ncbi:MAG: carboxylesterase family protein [Lachnospiraceae bacterium]|nr:carboxylesterase family protein [Lachnospiraceae bacterium]
MRTNQVRTENGIIRGVNGWDPRVTAFKGIPYAKPPVGELRWKSPQPAENWEGVRIADHFAPISVQNQPGVNPEEFWTEEIHPAAADYPQSEDCLYLNVFTCAKTYDEKMPVLFYIHGGGYQGGYPYEVEFDWEHMARKGIVVVSAAYRLGALGFLAHPLLSAENPDAPKGNFGLEDQLAAIAWTKRNIAVFGGDPDRITIAGQSAGAGSVQNLITSPFSAGMIQGAIVESGVIATFPDSHPGLTPQSLEKAEEIGERFFEKAGIRTMDEARALPAEQVLAITNEMGRGVLFSPTVDGIFLPETPFEAYVHNTVPAIPMIVGYNLGETRGFMRLWSRLPETLEELYTYADRYGADRGEFLRIADAKSDEDVVKLFDSDGFCDFIAGSRLVGALRAKAGQKAYIYEFDPEIPGDDNAGSYHGCEMWFAYDSLARCWRPFSGKHYDLARQTSSYWVNFVKTGDPNGLDTNGCELPRWEAYTVEDRYVQSFTDVPAKLGKSEDELMKFRMEIACRAVTRQ